MNFKKLRQASGMNQSEFARYFHIPLRTVQNWEAGTRSCPTYLMELMEYKLNNEGMIKGEVQCLSFFVLLNALCVLLLNVLSLM